MDCWIAHPGGKKVLDAYVEALEIEEQAIQPSREILKHYGNMSSATVIYVLHKCMTMNREQGNIGLACALGPGFSSELLLVRWGHNVLFFHNVHFVNNATNCRVTVCKEK